MAGDKFEQWIKAETKGDLTDKNQQRDEAKLERQTGRALNDIGKEKPQNDETEVQRKLREWQDSNPEGK